MKNIYFDTEFTGLHQKTTLISIGLVSDCGKKFYAEFTDYNRSQCDDWIKQNVIANLILEDNVNIFSATLNPNDWSLKGDKYTIAHYLSKWLNQFESIEMWSDCLSYDWVLFRDLFDNKIPENILYIPFDICTTFKEKGIDPDINREEFSNFESGTKKHNSLHDAKVIKRCHEKLKAII